MLSKGDDYPIHQTPEPIAYAGSDRNFYDRYFFNGYTPDGDLYFAAALGVYPHLNIMDAAFGVRIGDRQYNLHASRHLNMERMDTQVGPIRVEVLEPLRRLRLVVDDNEHAIAADLTFEGWLAPIEEPRVTRRNGPRMFMDSTRMTQPGRYSGWLRAGGQQRRFERGQLQGTRDRSWGVRTVGMRDPQPLAPEQSPQLHWFWVPAIFDDRLLLFYINEDEHGVAWNRGAVIAKQGSIEELHGAVLTPSFQPGTRWPASATITAVDGKGARVTVELETGPRFFLFGIGYLNPEWGHGLNKGPLAVGYDELRTADIAKYEPPYLHVQAFTKTTLVDASGERLRGVGAFESLCMGPHAPLGFKGFIDAP